MRPAILKFIGYKMDIYKETYETIKEWTIKYNGHPLDNENVYYNLKNLHDNGMRKDTLNKICEDNRDNLNVNHFVIKIAYFLMDAWENY